jgi:hypothetical protein
VIVAGHPVFVAVLYFNCLLNVFVPSFLCGESSFDKRSASNLTTALALTGRPAEPQTSQRQRGELPNPKPQPPEQPNPEQWL